MRNLDGKVALVTGAGRGIGEALALKLARHGARVVVNDLDAASVDATIDAIRATGGEAVACAGSVTDATFGARFIATALDTWGGIDIIVNNAGYTWDNVIQKMSDEQFDAMYDVHVRAPFRILRAAADPIRRLAKEEAVAGREVFRKVVNISSVSGLSGNPGQVNYSAAKSALVGMTKTLSREWGRYKVNVNCVAFGFIQTRLTQALRGSDATIEIDGRRIAVGLQPALIEAADALIPLGRAGTTEEAANGVYLFCTPESDYISGQVVTVGGGANF